MNTTVKTEPVIQTPENNVFLDIQQIQKEFLGFTKHHPDQPLPPGLVKKVNEHYALITDYMVFVERWAVHHGSKPHMSPQEALSFIQHDGVTSDVTKTYTDGVPAKAINIKALENQTIEAIKYLKSKGVNVLMTL